MTVRAGYVMMVRDRNPMKEFPVGGVSPHWQDMRAKWRAHVAAVQSDLDEAGDEIEASYAIVDADLAESCAMEAIGFAAAAMYCRTRASLLNP